MSGMGDKIKGTLEKAAGHVTGDKSKVDEGKAQKAMGEAEQEHAAGQHAFTTHGQTKEEAKAAGDAAKSGYYDTKTAGERATGMGTEGTTETGRTL